MKEKEMMTRLFASAFLIAGLSQAALAQTSTGQNQPSMGTEQNQPSMGTNQNQPSMGTGQNRPSMGTGQNQPSMGTGQNQPSMGTGQNQPSMSTGQNQPSTSTGQNQPSAENMQAPQNLPQALRQRLMSAGFSDVNIIPRSFIITAKDRNGRPVMMRITPNSMFFLTEVPAGSSSTTGAGSENSDDSGQRR